MSYRIEKTVFILDKKVVIECYNTGQGIQVLLEGGDRGHIGAVAVAAPDAPTQLITLPGHKETCICRKWAETLCERYQVPVVVEAGIHYNHIGEEGIMAVLRCMDEELQFLLAEIEKEERNNARADYNNQ